MTNRPKDGLTICVRSGLGDQNEIWSRTDSYAIGACCGACVAQSGQTRFVCDRKGKVFTAPVDHCKQITIPMRCTALTSSSSLSKVNIKDKFSSKFLPENFKIISFFVISFFKYLTMIFPSALFTLAAYAGLVQGQYPSKPTDLTVVQSKLQPEVQISYKEV